MSFLRTDLAQSNQAATASEGSRLMMDFSLDYAKAVELLLGDNLIEARAVIKAIPGGTIIPGISPRRLPLNVQVATFNRDQFTCRYCGRKTVLPPVLRLLSQLFDADFMYHLHGKMTDCHLAFWRDISSCDHLVPVARGGSSDISNLMTACYMCNSIKQGWLIDEMRWNLMPIATSTWDGLSSTYPSLLKILPAPHDPYFKRWDVALRQVKNS